MTRPHGSSLAVGALVAALALVGGVPAAAGAQQSAVALEAQFRGYEFGAGLGPSVANLLLFPAAYRFQPKEEVVVDVYSAWGRGAVEQAGIVYELTGFVDTRAKVSWRATEWAEVSVGVNIPTGNARHTGEEALVAAFLSNDLLGFEESNWGQGVGVTTGIATATQMGDWGVGLGASYRVAEEYEPIADSVVGYTPGNELRLRLGVDRNIGESGTFTAGVTYQNFSDDQVSGRDLFAPGARVLVDASYAFRTGASTWTVYAADVWRENGDLFLDIVDGVGAVVGDTTLVTPSQNLVLAGVSGSVPVGPVFRIRPQADVRIQQREEADGSTAGSGFVASAGLDLPVRFFGRVDVIPALKVMGGRIEGADSETFNTVGTELSLLLSFTF